MIQAVFAVIRDLAGNNKWEYGVRRKIRSIILWDLTLLYIIIPGLSNK